MQLIALSVVLLSTTVLHSSARAGEPARGPARSPLTFAPATNVVPSSDPPPLIQGVARQIMGANPLRPTFAMLSDRSGFGEVVTDRAVWIFEDRRGRVTNGEDTLHVAINVAIDASDGTILAAYTTPQDEWTLPNGEERDPEWMAQHDLWTVSHLDHRDLTRSSGDVLGVLWKGIGISPDGAGQIVLRPRRVRTVSPGRRTAEGLVPSYPEGPIWIVEVRGWYQEEDSDVYWTGMLVLIDDRTLDFMKWILMP